MTDKAAGKDQANAEQAAQDAKAASRVRQEANQHDRATLGSMAKEFAQQAYTTKEGNELQLHPQDGDDSEQEGETEVREDGTVVKKPKKEKKRRRGDKYSKYAVKESNEKNIDMRDLYTEDPSKYYSLQIHLLILL